MNCFQHPQAAAVAQCTQCGKGLCITCAQQYEQRPLCQQCASSQVQAVQTNYKRILIGCGVGALLGLAFVGQYAQEYPFIIGLFFKIIMLAQCAAFPIGWHMIGRLMQKVSFHFILAIPIAGVAFLYFAKAICSLMFGIFTVPVFLKRYRQAAGAAK